MKAKAIFLNTSVVTSIAIYFDIDDGTKGYSVGTAFSNDRPVSWAKELMEHCLKNAVEDLASKYSLAEKGS